jgi:hypothetical protein
MTFTQEAKAAAARDINAALEAGWRGFAIGERIPLRRSLGHMNLPNTQ